MSECRLYDEPHGRVFCLATAVVRRREAQGWPLPPSYSILARRGSSTEISIKSSPQMTLPSKSSRIS